MQRAISIGLAIDGLQASFRADLLPALEDRFADLQIGVAELEDFAFRDYGADCGFLGDDRGKDQPFNLLQAPTSDADAIADAIDGRIGGACLRPDVAHVVILLGDGEFHEGPPDGAYRPYDIPDAVPTPHTWPEAIDVTPPSEHPRFFRVTLVLVADGVRDVSRRTIVIQLPASSGEVCE